MSMAQHSIYNDTKTDYYEFQNEKENTSNATIHARMCARQIIDRTMVPVS